MCISCNQNFDLLLKILQHLVLSSEMPTFPIYAKDALSFVGSLVERLFLPYLNCIYWLGKRLVQCTSNDSKTCHVSKCEVPIVKCRERENAKKMQRKCKENANILIRQVHNKNLI
jgi:hypothetical protein